MRNNDTGEFELVVGNKQLLSGFFIVVLLFAVAFAMGYVVGQNSPRSAKMAAEAGGSPVTSTADARPQAASPPPVPVSAAAPTGQAPPDAAQPTTQPAQGSQPPAEKAADKPADAPAAASASASGIVPAEDLPPGNFWQVIAVKPEVSDAMRQTLRDKGFQVSLTPGSNNLTRVLVGPFSDTQAMGKAKTELENAGFRPVRYKRD
jgi:cell division protein FtsN